MSADSCTCTPLHAVLLPQAPSLPSPSQEMTSRGCSGSQSSSEAPEHPTTAAAVPAALSVHMRQGCLCTISERGSPLLLVHTPCVHLLMPCTASFRSTGNMNAARSIEVSYLAEYDKGTSCCVLCSCCCRATINRYGFNSAGADAAAAHLDNFWAHAEQNPSIKPGTCFQVKLGPCLHVEHSAQAGWHTGVLQAYCQSTASDLPACCDGAAGVLQVYCQSTTTVLSEYCQNTTTVPSEYCKPTR